MAERERVSARELELNEEVWLVGEYEWLRQSHLHRQHVVDLSIAIHTVLDS